MTDNKNEQTLVRGRHVLGDTGWIDDGAVLISDGRIDAVGPFDVLSRRAPNAVVIGNGRDLVVPGLIDAHTHGYGVTRIQGGVGYDFLENMLLDEPWRIALPSDLAAALCAVRHLKAGGTMVHHTGWDDLGPEAIVNAEKAIAAYQATGIRLAYSPAVRNVNRFACDEKDFVATLPDDLKALAQTFIDYDPKVDDEQFFEVFEHLYERFNGPDMKILLGPSWAHGCSDAMMQRIKARADALGGVPIHIHTLQTPHQRAYGIKKHGKSLLRKLDDIGLVDTNTVFGHMVWITEDDIALLAERGASVTHHASCNLHVRNGISPVYAMLQAGVNVAMGIDDKSINDDEDPFMEMRLIHQLHRVSGFDLEGTPALTGADVLTLATTNAARVCGFDGDVGVLKPGMMADLVIVDADPVLNDPWVAPDADKTDLLVARTKGEHVKTTMVGGRVVYNEGTFPDFDVEGLYAEVRAFCARGLSDGQKARQEPIRRLMVHHQRWHNAMLKHLDVSNPFYRMNARS